MAFAELGPSFIKLAQILSIPARPDHQAVCRRVQEAAGQGPPFPAEEAFLIIEQETGMKLDQIFPRSTDACRRRVHRPGIPGPAH